MRQPVRFISLLVAPLVLLVTAVACTPASTPVADVAAVRAYADPATETTLHGLSEGNLAKYVQASNDAFKAAVTREVFDKAAIPVNNQLGSYVSKEFLWAEEQGGYVLVHYKARFSKGEVGVRMVFDKDHLVAGQWFE